MNAAGIKSLFRLIARYRAITFSFLILSVAGYASLPGLLNSVSSGWIMWSLAGAAANGEGDPSDDGERVTEEKFVRAGRKVPNKYIVVFDDHVAGPRGENSKAATLATELAGEFNGRVERIFRYALNGFSVEMPEERAIAMSRDPRVKYVEEDSIGTASDVQPNATWGLDRIDQRNQPLDTLYNYNLTGAGVTAYVMDTGIRTSHTDFGGRASIGFDVIGGTGSDSDCNGHGTHVAGTVGGTTWGVAKNVSLVSVRVLGCTGFGSVSSFIAGVDWVTANAVRPAIANMSLGTTQSDALDTAVNNSITSGITYVVAAGNETQNACNISPARAGAAITVSASDVADQKAGFANYGICVDMFAPGVGIESAWHTSDTATSIEHGTSMAAPHIAGAAALYLQANPGATPSQVRAFLYSETTKGIIGASNSPTNHLLYTNWPATPILPPNNAPTASFTHNCNGTTCTFDGSASSDTDGTIAAYAWDFGDGQIGYGQTIIHSYASFSTFFSVTLRVLDDDGDTSSPSIVNGNTLLGTNITINDQWGYGKVTFPQVTATGHTRLDQRFSVPPYGNTICDTCPMFDVSTTATHTSPATACLTVPAATSDQTFNSMYLLRYSNFDNPPVNITTARVTHPDGKREVCGESPTVGTYAIATQLAGPPPQSPPTLSNTAVTPVNENGIATLTGNISDPNVDDTFTLTVNWGDGSAPQTFNYAAGTTSFSETHQYLDNPPGQPNGAYLLNMTLADSAGGQANWALNAGVSNVAPTLSNFVATPSTIVEGGTTTVSGNISDPGTLDSITVTIDWRDPSSGSTVLDLPAGTTSFSAQHQYSTAGNYDLFISVRDKDFAATAYNPAVSVTVNQTPPPDLSNVQVTSPISENGTATLTGNFSSQVANSTFSLELNWGDGSQPQTFNYQAGTTTFSEIHQYLDNPAGAPNGSYTINLTLTDNSGGEDTASNTVTVNNVSPTLSNVQVSPNPITAGGSTALSGTLADPGTLDSQIVSIDWGDGSAATTLNLTTGETNIGSTHQYTQAGDFDITVTATDKDGGQTTAGTAISVVAPPPTPSPTPVAPRVPDAPFTEIGLDGSAFAGLTPGPDNGRLYAVTYDGPVSDNQPGNPGLDAGTLYSVDRDLTNRIDHYTFIAATDGDTPYNELTWVPATGKFYGATDHGGPEGSGKIFTFDPATNEFATMPGGFTGRVWGSLVLANGYLYGTVQSFPEECIFRLRPADFAVTFLQCVPWGSSLQGVTLGNDGWLYGNSLYSGIACDPNYWYGCGEIFKIRPWNDGEPFDPQYQVIFQFRFYGGFNYPCPPGDKFCVRFPHTQNYPVQKLVYASDGYLYGSTFYSVFRLNPNAANVTDSFRTLWNDGGGIQATVIEGLDGRLYFTDYGGGSDGVGRIASMNKDGSGVFELRNFDRNIGSRATGPWGRLFHDPVTGRLYGTTEYTNEASPWPGTAFSIGIPPTEYRLSGSADGTAPVVVDDALDIYVNDALFYTDGIAPSGERGTIPVPEGYFRPGDIVRFEVRDVYGDCRLLTPIYLVDNFGNSTLMTPGFPITCGWPAGDNGVVFSDTFTIPGTANSAPVISSFSVPTALNENGVANLSFLVSDPDASDTLTITINWGDGTPNEVFTTPAGNNIPINLFHQYLDDNPTGTPADNNLLTVTVTDGVAVDTKSESILISNLVPFIVGVDADPDPITVGGTTTVSGTFWDTGTLDTFTVEINWGDGSTVTQLNLGAGATSFNAAHQYNGIGRFTINVTLTDDDGGTAAAFTDITVNALPPPNAPTNLVATAVTPTRIDLTWSDNSNNETGFIIERCKGKIERCKRFIALPSLVADTTSFSDTGVAKGATYVYRVYAVNEFGSSGFSNLASATTARR